MKTYFAYLETNTHTISSKTKIWNQAPFKFVKILSVGLVF